MSKYQSAFAFEESVFCETVVAAFHGDDLHLPIASFKIIVMHQGIAAGERVSAHADTDGFATIGAEWFTALEIIAVYAMLIVLRPFIVQLNNESSACIELIADYTVIDPVLLSPERDPVIIIRPAGFAEVLEHTLGEPAMIGEIVSFSEIDDGLLHGIAIGKMQSGNSHMITSEADERIAGAFHAAGRFCHYHDGLFCGAAGGNEQWHILPGAIGEHDAVSRLCFIQRRFQLLIIFHGYSLAVTCVHGQQQGCDEQQRIVSFFQSLSV